MTLREIIVEEIRRRGPVPFARYMELCLYHPELGYYLRPQEKFGKAGDFYTSSDVHALFGRLIARQFDEMWRVLGSPTAIDLVELGPGRGLFAADVLDWCNKTFPDFARPLRYVLVEQSEALRMRLEDRLSQHLLSGKARIAESFDDAEQKASENLIVFANEFFDALPVEIVDHRGAVRVGESGGQFVEQFVPPSAAEMEYLDSYSIHPGEGERVEVSLSGSKWMRQIAKAFEGRQGFAVFIDYGYTREQQLAGRFRDTLMTYRKHRPGDSYYQNPGEDDITAHVNFTALCEMATKDGLDPLGLVTQSQFLLGIGEETEFSDAFEPCVLLQERAKVALQLKHLISPEAMGETFQVLVLSRGIEKEKAARLSGL